MTPLKSSNWKFAVLIGELFDHMAASPLCASRKLHESRRAQIAPRKSSHRAVLGGYATGFRCDAQCIPIILGKLRRALSAFDGDGLTTGAAEKPPHSALTILIAVEIGEG